MMLPVLSASHRVPITVTPERLGHAKDFPEFFFLSYVSILGMSVRRTSVTLEQTCPGPAFLDVYRMFVYVCVSVLCVQNIY